MNNLQKVKLFTSIAKPSLWVWLLEVLCFLLMFVLGIFAAIPSANAITSLTAGNFKSTTFWLILSFVIVFIEQFLTWLADRFYFFNMHKVWQNIHSKIYDKVSSATSESFVTTSKEKIINIAYSNIGAIGDFPHYAAKYLSYFVQAITSITILLTYNFIIGIAIVAVCIIIFFAQNFFNKKIEKYSDKFYYYQDKSLEVLTDNFNNREITSDLDLTSQLNKKYLNNIKNSQTAKKTYGKFYSITDNWVPFFYKLVICALCIYMVLLTKANFLTLTLYLVLTNYLTSSITKMTNSFVIIDKLDSTNVACLRVKNILEMKQEDIPEFGKNTEDNVNGEVIFTNASYISSADDFTGNINEFNLKLTNNSATLFYGTHLCGKRAIFYMLNRTIKPTTGTITLDKINIYDFDKETYKHNFAVATSKNYLYNDTIMKNLQLSGASKTDIYNTCKKLGIHDKIVSTTNSYNTNLNKEKTNLNSFDIYLLGIARALCTNAEVICLYEFPSGLTIDQRDRIKSLIKYISKTRTVIIFSYNNLFSDVCKNVYRVQTGTIKKEST